MDGGEGIDLEDEGGGEREGTYDRAEYPDGERDRPEGEHERAAAVPVIQDPQTLEEDDQIGTCARQAHIVSGPRTPFHGGRSTEGREGATDRSLSSPGMFR